MIFVPILLNLIFQSLVVQILGAPHDVSIQDLFNHPDIPVLPNLNSSLFNVTAHHDINTKASKCALNLQYILCSITMDGRNQGNWQPFLVTGQLLITSGLPSTGTQNGANPVEAVIIIGNPPANPVAGSMFYTTNRYLNRFIGGAYTNSLADYAYVGTSGNTVTVTVDNRIAAANQLSCFNARSGLLAGVYVFASGGFQINLAAASGVAGSINVIGQGYISPYQTPYKAIVSGKIIGRGTTTV